MGLGKALKKVAKQVREGVKDAPAMARQIGEIGALPLQVVAGSLTSGLSAGGDVLAAAAPVLGQATGILQANPMLGQALGAAVPGLAPFLGGAAGTGQQAMQAYDMPEAAPGYGGGGGTGGAVPVWVWIAAAGAALVGLFMFTRKD